MDEYCSFDRTGKPPFGDHTRRNWNDSEKSVVKLQKQELGIVAIWRAKFHADQKG
jgi:hypothetical protein